MPPECPPGVFNLVNGDGPGVGAAIAAHPDVDMVSFTGSTRAGVAVAKAAADTVKRVHQELGGKSPFLVLDDADVSASVTAAMRHMLTNSRPVLQRADPLARPARADGGGQGGRVRGRRRRPRSATRRATPQLGPVVSDVQWAKIQGLIERGVAEGATLVCGGPGRPDGLESGYYVRPTVFGDVDNDMTIAREEIFGPVMSIIGYDDEEQAVEIANDTPYGLAAYVHSSDAGHARKVAARLRAGQVNINGAELDFMAPFGGYKQSGNGREWGDHAFDEFLETKAILGHA